LIDLGKLRVWKGRSFLPPGEGREKRCDTGLLGQKGCPAAALVGGKKKS